MKDFILEACVDSVESAINAVKGGANRLELCANLVIGGTTPGVSQFKQIRKLCDVPIHVLIRPRFGDFLYTDSEFLMVAEDSKMFCEAGADGIVVGVLKPEGDLDIQRLNELREAAGNRHMTLHRAFDVCRDPHNALKEAISIGVNTILTSGQRDHCMDGKELLKDLIALSGDRLDILVGSGVNAEVIGRLIDEIHAACFHMSGKLVLDSGMVYRKQEVNMGVPGLGEYDIFRTDEAQIRDARNVLDRIAKERRE